MQNASNRSKQQGRRGRRYQLTEIFSFLLLISLGLGAHYGWKQLTNPVRFPVRAVEIRGETQHVDRQVLQEVITQKINDGFFGLNVEGIRKVVKDLPWVKEVDVRRQWPGRVTVTLYEQNPVARWGSRQLLTEEGEVIDVPVKTIPKNLPELYGPQDKAHDVLEEYREMCEILEPRQHLITRLEMAPRGSWRLRLDDGVDLWLGRDDILNRVRQYVRLYPKILEHTDKQAVSIDLRYPNGMAIKWRA